jgi:glucokinase
MRKLAPRISACAHLFIAKQQALIPIAVYGKKQPSGEIQHVLAADVGGTKANLALYKVQDLKMEIVKAHKYSSQDYSSFIDIIRSFIHDVPVQPQKICIGVAGPVINGEVEFTNLSWSVSEKEIAQHTGVTAVALINDLEATAYGLACLPEEDLLVLHPGKKTKEGGNIAIIAPGTGLGEAALFYDGRNYHPFATEGGHSSFSTRTDTDVALYHYLRSKEQVVSWEHVIAGPGIHSIYQFLRTVEKMEEPQWLKEALEQDDPSAVISKAAIGKKAAICERTMQLYIRYLAYESANLVLKMKSSGGLFLGGGIPPKILPLLKDTAFYEAYRDCDRMHDLVEAVPIKVILNDKTALLGAAYFGAHGI